MKRAAARFAEGDNAGLAACLDEHVVVYAEPEFSTRPLLQSRAAVAAWLKRERERMGSRVSVDVLSVSEHGPGVVTEIVIVAEDEVSDAWRLALAVRCENDLIAEVRTFRDSQSAEGWLLGLR